MICDKVEKTERSSKTPIISKWPLFLLITTLKPTGI